MTPILSIITINYNNKDGLKKTIESVVTQTETNFEYIIIDGASTDGSAELIKEYAEHPEYGKKITHWVSEPDTGIYNAMNKGIDKANGEYLHMLNSGDWYESDALTQILPKIEKEKPDALLTIVNFWQKEIKIYSEIRYSNRLPYGSMLHQGTFYKKSIHQSTSEYDETYKIAADYDFFSKAFYNTGLKFSFVFVPCVNFPIGGLGHTDKNALTEFYRVQNKYFGVPQVKKNYTKKIIKLFVPYGIIVIIRKIKRLFKRGH